MILIYAIAEIEKAISRKVILKQDEIIEEKFGSLDDIDDEEYNQYFKNISKKELKDILTKTYSNLLLEKDNISLLKNICTEQMLENLNELTEINMKI